MPAPRPLHHASRPEPASVQAAPPEVHRRGGTDFRCRTAAASHAAHSPGPIVVRVTQGVAAHPIPKGRAEDRAQTPPRCHARRQHLPERAFALELRPLRWAQGLAAGLGQPQSRDVMQQLPDSGPWQGLRLNRGSGSHRLAGPGRTHEYHVVERRAGCQHLAAGLRGRPTEEVEAEVGPKLHLVHRVKPQDPSASMKVNGVKVQDQTGVREGGCH